MLKKLLTQAIQDKGGLLTFERYMTLCLYAPGLGYYSGDNYVFGKEGDFVTAPEISPLFGQCIAKQLSSVFKQPFDILELGAGTGKLAVDILHYLDAIHALPQTYFILEVSAGLKARQRETLAAYPHLLERCEWLNTWPKTPIKGAIIANEVLDAMPATLFRKSINARIEECFVGLDAQGELQPLWQEANPELTEKVKALGSFELGYQSEINLAIKPWLASMYEALSQGMVLLIDYGFDAATYYHPDRNSGTLMCHYQHKSHTDPFIHLGKQDITTHVDFTDVANSAFELGFDVSGYTNQAAFLIANGITELLEKTPEDAYFKTAHAVKMLTMPQEMGELFKVMALTKNCDEGLTGFELADYRSRL